MENEGQRERRRREKEKEEKKKRQGEEKEWKRQREDRERESQSLPNGHNEGVWPSQCQEPRTSPWSSKHLIHLPMLLQAH